MLADKLYELNSFKKQYRALLILSVCRTIEKLSWDTSEDDLLNEIDWNNIIGIASVLSYSENNKHLDAALRIAQTVLSEQSSHVIQKEAAAVILVSLTNNPAIKLAIKRGMLSDNFFEELPLSLKLQNYKSAFENSIIINVNPLSLNRFQSEVYNSYKKNNAISISAPTSAGKSFILCNIIIDELLKCKKNIVYLVPTRALISQVEDDLRTLLSEYNLSDKANISTVPQNDIDGNISNIFVFTQERLHWFLIDSLDSLIDILVVDEAHKIEDSYRGILLQQKIENLLSDNEKIKIYFSSPFTSNPELLLENINNNLGKGVINTQFVSVNQNLIYANQFPRKPDKWKLSLCLVDETVELGFITLGARPTTENKKITFISESFSNNGTGSVLYANGAANAEDISLILYEFLPDEAPSEKILDLIDLAKKTIHKDYRLVTVLEKRIAFHYGNMPLLIRQEVEKLFKLGEIKYLICTSTLLEGVNLPAKSVFIRKPTRGINTPLNQNDFWNLAGRAGRWGKEFSGNIICIEPSNWKIPPSPNRSKQKIVRALDIIEKNYQDLIHFIKNDSPRDEAEKRQDLEFAFGYYFIKFLESDLDETSEFEGNLHQLFTEIEGRIQLPEQIIKRNPGVSPIAQQNLWDYFESKLDLIETMIPVYPEDSDAFNEYTKFIGRIGKTLSFYPHQLNKPRAILLINWMSGKPLSYLIKKSYKSYKKNPRYADKKIHTVIREVMSDVENFARFRFAKDSSCYIDILRYFLETKNRLDLLENIPQLNLWLEFGVAQKTHLSLLSIGLSRNTVIELSNYITDTNMSREQALIWLKEQDYGKFEFPTIILNDIKSKIENS